MLKRLNQYRPIHGMLLAVCAVMTLLFYLREGRHAGFFICVGLFAAALVSTVLWDYFITRSNKTQFAGLKADLERVMSDAVAALPYAAFIVREDGEIIWVNGVCKRTVFPGQELFGANIRELMPGFEWQTESTPEGVNVEICAHKYTAYLMHSSVKRGNLTIVGLVDDHDLKVCTQQYFDSRPYVLTMVIDNYTELFTDAKENERSKMMGDIEHIIESFAEENHGMVKKLERDRYLCVMEERYMKKVLAERFKILDAIRGIDAGDRPSPTLSIGVGSREGNLHESEEISRQALDMALGRGGDQAAVKQKNGYEFFGGVSRGVEKRNKVRTRIMANAITEVARTCDNILIMGHRFADLDCLGAGIGMYAGLSFLGKPCKIVLDTEKSLAQPLYEHYIKDNPEHESAFVSPYHALELINKNTLLIVVDTHIANILESRAVYEQCRSVVIIDHHRKMVDHINNAIIFFHEPYASSASEMVSELVQYFNDGKVRISVSEAEALLAGVMLDTKNFTLHTGARTFEAAAYLRRMGADTVEVRKLFSSSMESYQERSRLVGSAEIYRGCAIAYSLTATEDIRVVAPQAADDLLGISDVDASFVLFEDDSTVNISGRSMGVINVQVILEYMGGGGHQTMAGAQIKNVPLEDCRQRLLEAIDRYFDENNKGGNER